MCLLECRSKFVYLFIRTIIGLSFFVLFFVQCVCSQSKLGTTMGRVPRDVARHSIRLWHAIVPTLLIPFRSNLVRTLKHVWGSTPCHQILSRSKVKVTVTRRHENALYLLTGLTVFHWVSCKIFSLPGRAYIAEVLTFH